MPLTRHETDVDQLAAPAEDGGVLAWPEPDRIIELINENQLQREQVEGKVGSNRRGALPILVGHQPEMMHPGVWIKLVAATRLARRTSRNAMFVCVDHDLANGIPLHVPIREAERWRTHTIKLGHPGLHSFEQEPVRNTDEWFALFNDPVIPADSSAWPVFKDAFLESRNDPAMNDYVGRWSLGINALLSACGESPIDIVRIRDVFLPDAPTHDNQSFKFVAKLLRRASEFAWSYNRALGEYRRQRGIRGDAHPIPDLAIDSERVELPFWIVRGDQPRSRLYVRQSQATGITFFAGASTICSVDSRRLESEPEAALRESLGAWRIRPRALSLTLFLRLHESDLFIHGIGGAKYDVITDAIMRDFFCTKPPGYACVTATARLPFDQSDSTGVVNGVATAVNQLRAARFNPQRVLPPSQRMGDVAVALAERERGISDGRNLRETARKNHAARRSAFQRIRNANQRIADLCPTLVDDAERSLAFALRTAEDRVVTYSREWFTGLYAIDQLRALCAKLPW